MVLLFVLTEFPPYFVVFLVVAFFEIYSSVCVAIHTFHVASLLQLNWFYYNGCRWLTVDPDSLIWSISGSSRNGLTMRWSNRRCKLRILFCSAFVILPGLHPYTSKDHIIVLRKENLLFYHFRKTSTVGHASKPLIVLVPAALCIMLSFVEL